MNKNTPKNTLHEDEVGMKAKKHVSSFAREAGECSILPPKKPDPGWNWQYWRKQAAFAEKFCYSRSHSPGHRDL